MMEPLDPLVDRKTERAALDARFDERSSLSLVYGQRRTGKSFLLRHAVADRPGALVFQADESTSALQLARFRAEARAAGLAGPSLVAEDWGSVLDLLVQGAALDGRPLLLVLDECQYLFAAEPTLPSILQRVIDQWRARTRLHVVLCGSALGTLRALGDVGQPLYGRFDLRLQLHPFGYADAAAFAPAWSRRQKLQLYGLFGGLARHLALVDPERELADNVCRLLLDPLGPLSDAVPDLLRGEHFSRRAEAAGALSAIGQGEGAFGVIASKTGLDGPRTDYVLKELLAVELIRRVARYGDAPGSRYTRYRPADPFLAAWYRFIEPNRSAVYAGSARRVWDERIAPGLSDAMGPVFEEVARQAVAAGALGPVDEAAPWWSRDGTTEIDLVVRSGSRLVACEVKWGVCDLPALHQLRAHVGRQPELGKRDDVELCLVSGEGFADRLRRVAEVEGVALIGPEALLPAG